MDYILKKGMPIGQKFLVCGNVCTVVGHWKVGDHVGYDYTFEGKDNEIWKRELSMKFLVRIFNSRIGGNMDDFNTFYVKSLESGATTDNFGNIQHTPASMTTFSVNQEFENFQKRVNQELQTKPLSFWDHLFG